MLRVSPGADLLSAACSSIFPGAGTNQELALHYLHESRGDILVRKILAGGSFKKASAGFSLPAARTRLGGIKFYFPSPNPYP